METDYTKYQLHLKYTDFIEPENSLSCSREPVNGNSPWNLLAYLVLFPFNHFSIIMHLDPTSQAIKKLALRFTDESIVLVCLLLRVCYGLHPPHSPLFNLLKVSAEEYEIWSSSSCIISKFCDIIILRSRLLPNKQFNGVHYVYNVLLASFTLSSINYYFIYLHLLRNLITFKSKTASR